MNKTINLDIMTTTSSGSSFRIPSGTRAVGNRVAVTATPAPSGARTKEIEKAVYAHIRALRALGRTTANSAEIARALAISPAEVEAAAAALQAKGVKVAS